MVQQDSKDALPSSSGRRIAVFNNEDAEKWKGYTEKLWRQLLEEPGDEWRVYHACAGDVPSLQEAQQYDFLLLGGSHYSVYEQHAWIAQLSELLRQCVAAGVKIVACCFGCQLLAQALGGVVGRNPSGRFVLTVERVEPSPQLQLYPGFATAMQAAMQQAAAARAPQPALPAALGSAGGTTPGTQLGSDLQGSDRSTAGAASAPRAGGGSTSEAQSPATAAAAAPAQPAVLMPAAMPAPEPLSEALGACGPCLRLLESHGDQVISLPPGALTLASSATAAHELWALPPNVLAFQYHVEFCQSLAYQKIWSALSANGRLDVQEAAASEQALTRAPPPDSSAMVRVIQHFVRHGLGPAALGGSVEPAAGSAAGTAGHDHAAGASASASVAAAAAAAVESAGSLLARLSLRPGPAAASSSGEPAAQGLATASGTAASGASASGASASGAAASSTAASGAAASGAAAGTPEAAPLPSSRPWSPSPSETGASSPTAASERSSLATSTAVPFAYLARQRQQKDREEALRDLSWEVVRSTGECFDARMEYHRADVSLLQRMCAAAADEFTGAADIAAALARFSADLGDRQAAVVDALEQAVPQLDAQLRELEQAVVQLDASSRLLEARVTPPPPAKAAASGSASSYTQGLFNSLQQTLQISRIGSGGQGSRETES